MQLRHARLCLNCEEIHSAAHCPVCTSESFAYVARWVPPGEDDAAAGPAGAAAGPAPPPRPSRPARPAPPAPSTQPRLRWVKRGAAGVAVLAASRLLWHLSKPVEWSTADLPYDLEEPELPPSDDEQRME